MIDSSLTYQTPNNLSPSMDLILLGATELWCTTRSCSRPIRGYFSPLFHTVHATYALFETSIPCSLLFFQNHMPIKF